MTLVRAYLWVTRRLGQHRRLVRRVAALCLVMMGVHLSADHLDDVLYRVLDALDLFVDDTAAAFLSWLANAGGLTPGNAAAASESFARFVDLPEKDRLAIAAALLVELVLDAMLLDLAWGRHVDEAAHSLVEELKQSALQVAAAFRPLDLERLAVMPTLLLFALGGATLAALAAEQVARGLLQRLAPSFAWSGQLAAALAIVTAALLLWRFLPDLLHGALLRSRARHDRAREKAMARLLRKHRFPRLANAVIKLRLGSRGTWLCVIALPLAVAGLVSHDLAGLVQRTELLP